MWLMSTRVGAVKPTRERFTRSGTGTSPSTRAQRSVGARFLRTAASLSSARSEVMVKTVWPGTSMTREGVRRSALVVVTCICSHQTSRG